MYSYLINTVADGELHRKSQRSHTTHCTTDYVILQHGGLDIVHALTCMIDCSAKKRAKAGIHGRQKGQRRKHTRRRHNDDQQILCSINISEPDTRPSAPPHHRPPCTSCPTMWHVQTLPPGRLYFIRVSCLKKKRREGLRRSRSDWLLCRAELAVVWPSALTPLTPDCK